METGLAVSREHASSELERIRETLSQEEGERQAFTRRRVRGKLENLNVTTRGPYAISRMTDVEFFEANHRFHSGR